MESARPRLIALACLLAVAAASAPSSPVADAAQRGDRDAVRSLLRDGADANAAQGDGMTALHWAAMRGDTELLQMLLYAGANPDATTRLGGYTPLLLASEYGRADALRALLEAGAPIDATTSNGTTALMLAAASGNDDAVQALLAVGADPDEREAAHGQTALIFAAARNYVAPITTLIEAGANPDLASDAVDVVAEEKQWREAFARKRREAQLRARLAEAEAKETAPNKAEGAAAELNSQEPPAGAGQESQQPVEDNKGKAGTEATPPGTVEQESPPIEDQELAGIPAAAAGSAAAVAAAGGPAQGLATEPTSESKGEPGGNEAAEPKPKRLSYGELIGMRGGLTPLHYAVRQGHIEAVQALLELGASIDQPSADGTSPLLMAVINGRFDLAMFLLRQGADPTLASQAGATPLYAAINVQWAPKALYPQPRAFTQQTTSYLQLTRALLQAGAPVNARLERKIWYSGYNFDLSGVDESGATPFWRAAYAGDVDAMKLLVSFGADPEIRTRKTPGRPRTGDATREVEDLSGLPPVPVGGPAVTALHAAAGVGYGEGFAANSHRHVPGSWLPAVRYLVEELGVDVNTPDHEGNTALHDAAARGDNEMILYLVAHGADVTVVNREGNTVADMANGPVQRIQPFPETVALLESLGSKNNHRCVSC